MAADRHPQNTVEILNRYQFRTQKRYGQNFLTDAHVLEKIIAAAEIGEEDFVLEIGPGIGTLTRYLCESAGKVLAVEIDKELIPILGETLSGYENVTVLNQDILKSDIPALLQEYSGGRPAKVVANLPYYITTPIIMELFESHVPLTSMTVMVQKEVAERMQASPGTKDYGALSLAVQYYAEAQIAANVPPNCFLPRPKVGSAVVCLKCLRQPPVQVRDEAFFFRVIRASFNQRRKTLVNGLGNDAALEVTKQQAEDALKELGWAATIRGEKLTLEQFAELSNVLADIRDHAWGHSKK